MLIVVTGAGGMLAADLKRAAERAGHRLLCFERGRLDITDAAQIAAALERLPSAGIGGAPEQVALVNCAAYTDVDGAESDERRAVAVNATGAGLLASACRERGIRMLHVSSDYVFGAAPAAMAGGLRRPFTERDAPAALGAYGRSKLAGEELVGAAGDEHLIVRTAWLFGAAGRNFVRTMLTLAGERSSVRVVDDQVGSPTWTGHLAPALVGLLERRLTGVVHLAGGGEVSWCGFAREIFRQADCSCEVLAIASADSNRAAPRPAYSALASERDDVLPLPPWQDGLAGYLAAQAGMMRA